MTLRLLPETLINRIAAGEVVERPASVVKELCENAIDAGASHIDVVLRDGGQSVISVDDDGCGMTPDELTLAVERHATSKLPDDDLMAISTMGFRGEALPSIGAVALLTITSRPQDAPDAWKITVEGGKKSKPEPAAHPQGTRVEVRDLFYATPARLKFMKTARTEQTQAVEILNRLAMGYPQIGFTLSDGNRHLIKLAPSQGDLFSARMDRLMAIMGREFADNAMPIEAEREGVRLTGYASLPTLNRGNAAMQFLFVNGRPVRDKLLVGALRGAYRDFLASNRHPLVALFLEVPSDSVDVNVHPAKTEVRFRDAALVRGLIVGSLKHALADAGHRSATTTSDAALGAFQPSPEPYRPWNHGANHGPSGVISSTLSERSQEYHAPFPTMDAAPQARPVEDGVPDLASTEQDYPLGVARGQLHATYVVAQTKDGIVIVDQHAAHERLVHERLKNSLEQGGVARQGLLIPEVLEMDEPAAERLLARTDELAELGLVIEGFGVGTIVVRETPALLGEMDIKGLLRDLADDLAEVDEALSLKDRLGDVCASMACHGSVRAGRQMNAAEMNALLREMEATPHSGQCSHGRPTYVELKLQDIEKLFGRR
jgi:DNA mismatch repair protein MutL